MYDPVMVQPMRDELTRFGVKASGPDPFDPLGWQRYSAPGSPNRVVLNSEGTANGDGGPSMLFSTGSQFPVVAWARNSASGFDLVVSGIQGGIQHVAGRLAIEFL